MSPSLPLCNRLLSRLECNRLPSRPYTYLRSSTGPLPPRASVAASARRATAFILSASATVSALAPVSALATVSALAPLPALARRHCFCFGHCHPSRADWPPLPLPLSVTDWPLPSLPYRLAAVAIAPLSDSDCGFRCHRFHLRIGPLRHRSFLFSLGPLPLLPLLALALRHCFLLLSSSPLLPLPPTASPDP